MLKIINSILLIGLLLASSGFADGHKLKVGMITTLSGGGSGLGKDVILHYLYWMRLQKACHQSSQKGFGMS